MVQDKEKERRGEGERKETREETKREDFVIPCRRRGKSRREKKKRKEGRGEEGKERETPEQRFFLRIQRFN